MECEGGLHADLQDVLSPTTVKSAEYFMAKLNNTVIQPDEIMVSFEVTSLFTSVAKELV